MRLRHIMSTLWTATPLLRDSRCRTRKIIHASYLLLDIPSSMMADKQLNLEFSFVIEVTQILFLGSNVLLVKFWNNRNPHTA